MDFARPQWLWALLALPLIAFLLAMNVRRARIELESFTGTRLAPVLAPGHSWRRHLLRGTLRVLALAAMIAAMAGPRFGTQLVKVDRQGIDIVLVLDTSLSMMAEDMLPNRLERAKQEMVDLIRGLDGDRVGIVAFAGDAYPLCPLTVDYEAALMFTRSIDVYTVSEPGTAIDRAIRASTALFDPKQPQDRAVILVTDGENHEGDPLGAAAEARDAGVRIFTIGIGNPSGELIPERGSDGSVSGYKKDRKGETVLTRLDEATLEQVASATGGRYLPATREGLELKVLYDEIAAMTQSEIKGEFVERRRERFWIFLLGALAALVIDALVSTRARRAPAVVVAVGLAVMFVVMSVVPGHARRVDRDRVQAGNERFKTGAYDDAIHLYRQAIGDTLRLPERFQGVYYNEANALYMQGKYEAALRRYQRAYSEDTTLTADMLYNRGNALLRGGKFQDAVASYVQALGYRPDDINTRHNLELALRMLQQQQQQQQDPQQEGEGDPEQQQQDQQQQGQQPPDSTSQQQQQQDPQQGEPDPEQQQQEQQQQQAQQDSTMVEPPQADSTSVISQPLTPDEMSRLSPEDAMRILQALEEMEKQLQKERRKAAFRRLKKNGKDW